MSAHSFRSIKNVTPRTFTEADVVNAARQLLDEHAASREAATKAENQVCGNCRGVGTMPSTVMPGEFTKCWACEGTGAPNEKSQSLPALTPDDHQRMWKLRQLLVNFPAFRPAVLAVIREAFPDMYSDSDGAPN